MTSDPASLSRRRVLAGTTAAGVGIPLLSACGGSNQQMAQDTEAKRPVETPGQVVGKVDDIAVGACAVFGGLQVVVTQPTAGEFKCFSAICTHAGCVVSSGDDGYIPCSCHGSHFDLSNGSVLAGPARQALPEVDIVVDGDTIRFA